MKICRLCEHLNPHDDLVYGYRETFVCYKNSDSHCKTVDSEACEEFELADILKEELDESI